MSLQHSKSNSIHKGAYIQSDDPGATGAKVLWIDTTLGYILKKRNETNDGWDTIADLSAILSTEAIQDVVGAMFANSSTIAFTYNDGSASETANVIDGSISNSKLANMANGTVKLRTSVGTGTPEDGTM